MENFNPHLLPDIDQAGVSETDLSTWTYQYTHQDYLTSLLNTSSYEGRMKDMIERDIDGNMEQDEYYALLFNLQNSQVDRISGGFNYSQTDILNHLRLLK